MFDKFSEKLKERFKKQEKEAPAATVAEKPAEVTEKPATTEKPDKSAEKPAGVAPAAKQEVPKPAPPAAKPPAPAKGGGLLDRLKVGLRKTREVLGTDVRDLFKMGRKIDDAFWESLEEVLIAADVGVNTTTRLIDDMKKAVKERGIKEPSDLTDIFKEDLRAMLTPAEAALKWAESGPTVVMVVGVNGTGKTTTIGKLAYQLKSEGKKVLLGAADTFRAAAIDQLQIWADRAGIDIIRLAENADPAAVAFDAVQAAKARGVDVLLLDTAGRLHSKVNLMEELKKVKRVLGKQMEGAPHEVLLVLDATTGQNAMQQAKTFGHAVDVSGLVLAKLDGTARGGIVVAIANQLKLPVKYIGIGESIDDLRPFDATAFVDALFATD